MMFNAVKWVKDAFHQCQKCIIDFIGMIYLWLAQRQIWLTIVKKRRQGGPYLWDGSIRKLSRSNPSAIHQENPGGDIVENCACQIRIDNGRYGRKSFADFGWSFKQSKRSTRPRQIPLHPGRSEEMPRHWTTAGWQFDKRMRPKERGAS